MNDYYRVVISDIYLAFTQSIVEIWDNMVWICDGEMFTSHLFRLNKFIFEKIKNIFN